MECNEIKSLLSEYLDRTLQNDLNRDVKEHLLSCKDCSNEFFLIKSISEELAGLERIKAPSYLLDRVNQAVTAPSWLSKIFDFIPGSGGFKVPMEFVTFATTVVLVFLIFFNINIERKENVMVAGSGRQNTVMNKESGGPIRLEFIPKVSTILQPVPTDRDNDVVSVTEGHVSDINPENLISNLNGIVSLAGGDIVSREFARNSGEIDAITVQIPSTSYNAFINRVEKMGRFEPPAPSLPHQSSAPVLLRIRLNLSE